MTDILSRVAVWFRACYPQPATKNLNTQMGVHFEEVGEMIDEISANQPAARHLLNEARNALGNLADYLKATDNTISIKPENRIGYLDALCDQTVTAAGCAHMSKMDIVGAMLEVNRSNYSKFDADGNPIFDENLKVKKGPNYTKPNLAPFV